MSGANEVCKKCRFFIPVPRRDPTSRPEGHCHRHAPRPLIGGSGTGWADWEWPAVQATEFCGEYKSR